MRRKAILLSQDMARLKSMCLSKYTLSHTHIYTLSQTDPDTHILSCEDS